MIAVIGAMEQEVTAFVELLSDCRRVTVGGVACVQAKLEDRTILVARSGIGKVNAAYTMTQLATHFPLEYCINIGSAGGLDSQFKVNDIILATQCSMHDFDIGNGFGVDERFNCFPDPQLNERAIAVLTAQNQVVHTGLLVCGDQFVHDPHHYQTILERFPTALACDMESYAIGKVCSLMNLPFIVLRSLSDIVFSADNALDFEQYLIGAARQSARFSYEFIINA